MTMTYSELLDYFTPEELDDAAIIARFAQHDFPHMSYGEIYIQVLKETWAATH
jgi:predicted ATPase